MRGAFQSRGFLLILYRERQILKLIKLVKPSFNKSEWVTDWSDLMISCFTSQTWGELTVNANALLMHYFFQVIQGND